MSTPDRPLPVVLRDAATAHLSLHYDQAEAIREHDRLCTLADAVERVPKARWEAMAQMTGASADRYAADIGAVYRIFAGAPTPTGADHE